MNLRDNVLHDQWSRIPYAFNCCHLLYSPIPKPARNILLCHRPVREVESVDGGQPFHEIPFWKVWVYRKRAAWPQSLLRMDLTASGKRRVLFLTHSSPWSPPTQEETISTGLGQWGQPIVMHKKPSIRRMQKPHSALIRALRTRQMQDDHWRDFVHSCRGGGRSVTGPEREECWASERAGWPPGAARQSPVLEIKRQLYSAPLPHPMAQRTTERGGSYIFQGCASEQSFRFLCCSPHMRLRVRVGARGSACVCLRHLLSCARGLSKWPPDHNTRAVSFQPNDDPHQRFLPRGIGCIGKLQVRPVFFSGERSSTSCLFGSLGSQYEEISPLRPQTELSLRRSDFDIPLNLGFSTLVIIINWFIVSSHKVFDKAH